jgi:hypothetical protein
MVAIGTGDKLRRDAGGREGGHADRHAGTPRHAARHVQPVIPNP